MRSVERVCSSTSQRHVGEFRVRTATSGSGTAQVESEDRDPVRGVRGALDDRRRPLRRAREFVGTVRAGRRKRARRGQSDGLRAGRNPVVRLVRRRRVANLFDALRLLRAASRLASLDVRGSLPLARSAPKRRAAPPREVGPHRALRGDAVYPAGAEVWEVRDVRSSSFAAAPRDS